MAFVVFVLPGIWLVIWLVRVVIAEWVTDERERQQDQHERTTPCANPCLRGDATGSGAWHDGACIQRSLGITPERRRDARGRFLPSGPPSS